LYFFPPGAWLDKPKQARSVAHLTVPLVAFEHQRDFYHALGLPVHFFGHPLAPAYVLRPERPAPPPDGGAVALLPGSREGELRHHLPALLDALLLIRKRRPNLTATIGAADAAAQASIEEALAQRRLTGVSVVRSARAALENADAAWIASGTAVLEAALCGVPTVALYILSEAQARIARRVYSGPYVTIPNLVLKKRVIPELLQENATPERLAEALDDLLSAPQEQYREFLRLRDALGPSDALDQCARFALDLARTS
jgi:lipid-A-disaccharide synthase